MSRRTDTHTHTQRNFLSTSSLPSGHNGQSWAEAKSPEFHSGLPWGRKGSETWTIWGHRPRHTCLELDLNWTGNFEVGCLPATDCGSKLPLRPSLRWPPHPASPCVIHSWFSPGGSIYSCILCICYLDFSFFNF